MKGQRIDFEVETFVTHVLRGEGYDASEDGTGRGTPIVPVAYQTSGNSGAWETGDITGALDTMTDAASHVLADQWGVRRLMPAETEILQGFPTGFTAIPYKRRKIEADEAEQCALGGVPVWQDDSGQWFTDCMADGPRYKAIGNSQAVPVVRWILQRVEQQLAPG